MNVLGLDTATPSTAVALLAGSEAIELRDDPVPGSRGEHTERVLVLADAALSRAGLDWPAIDLIGVGTGPGGYTGLRIGIATARGLARAIGAQLTGVCTLRALAQPLAGVVTLALIDGRRGELFAGAYKDDVEVIAPHVIRPAELPAVLARIGQVPLWAVGDGAIASRSELAMLDVEIPEDASQLHRVSAAAICMLARRDPDAAVEPLYLRRPDAELALER